MSTITTESKKRYNNYTLSVLFSTLVGIAIIVPALFMHGLDVGLLPEWIIDVVYAVFGIAFVSRLVSGSSYIFSLLDRIANEYTLIDLIISIFKKMSIKPENKKTSKQQLVKPNITETKKHLNAHKGQFVGNSIGFILGSIFAVITLILRATTPIIINSVISSGFYLINHISNFSGLFNRLGRTADYINKGPKKDAPHHSRFCRKNVNYAVGVILGAIASTILVTVILSVVGITSTMSLGGAVPIWLSLGLFVIGTISTGASAGGYVGRCIDFLIGKRTLAHAVADTIYKTPQTKSWRDRFNSEYSGTVIGVTVGIVLAVILIAAGVASLPFFGLGLPKLFAGMILMAACVSQCGGLGNRLGNMLDKFFDTRKPHRKDNAADITAHESSQTSKPPVSPTPTTTCNKNKDGAKYARLVDVNGLSGDVQENTSNNNTVAPASSNIDQEASLIAPANPSFPVIDSRFPPIAHDQSINDVMSLHEKKIDLKNMENSSIKNIVKMGIFNKSNHSTLLKPEIKIHDIAETNVYIPHAAAAA